MHNKSSYHLLIYGSVSATRDMLNYTRRAVRRAHQLGWIVLVADAPQCFSVAYVAVQECRRLKAKLIVAGIDNLPRNPVCRYSSYIKIDRELYRSAGGDLLHSDAARDRWLVDTCHRALFVWDGRAGVTQHLHGYAVQRGKDAHLINFSTEVLP